MAAPQRQARKWTGLLSLRYRVGTVTGGVLDRREEESMLRGTAKQKILQAIEKLPPDATFEDAIERLVFLAKVDRGLAELDAGRGVDHSEGKRRLGR
jgi:predicted transcriptional regulator